MLKYSLHNIFGFITLCPPPQCTDPAVDEQAEMRRMFLVFDYIGPDIRQSPYQVDLKINYVWFENRPLS